MKRAGLRDILFVVLMVLWVVGGSLWSLTTDTGRDFYCATRIIDPLC